MPITATQAIIGTGLLSAGSSLAAGNAQKNAAKDANATQLHIYNDSVTRQEPFRQQGLNALTGLSYEMGLGGKPANYRGFEASPGYQFQLDEGQRALDARGSASGNRLGGAATKDALRFSQGLASQEYGTYLNRLASMGGVGQTATNAQQNAGQNYASAYGANTMAAGNARASSYGGVNNALQGTANNYFTYQGMMNAGLM